MHLYNLCVGLEELLFYRVSFFSCKFFPGERSFSFVTFEGKCFPFQKKKKDASRIRAPKMKSQLKKNSRYEKRNSTNALLRSNSNHSNHLSETLFTTPGPMTSCGSVSRAFNNFFNFPRLNEASQHLFTVN